MNDRSAVRFADCSVVVLTFERREEVCRTVASVAFVADGGGEVIVVDNGADPDLAAALHEVHPQVVLVSLPRNVGVGGRNVGLRRVRTRYVVTLDDDVRGLQPHHLHRICRRFEEHADLGAICFKVVSEADPERVINWCHHRKVEEYADRTFATCEISEGAVAFRMDALRDTRLYPEEFFISHEGPALAMQLMNRGFGVWYCPDIKVTHAVSPGGRPGWRRYYYDTRNAFWLALGFLPMRLGARILLRNVAAMLVYSLRDGYFRYWLRGVSDGLKGARAQLARREAPSVWATDQLRAMQAERPSLLYLLRRRIFRKGVQI